MIDLDGAPRCRDCGAPMTVTEHPDEGPDGASMWSAACSASDSHWELLDRNERPTWRTEPGAAPLIAEIEQLRAELALVTRGLGSLSVQLGQASSERDRALEELADARTAELLDALRASEEP